MMVEVLTVQAETGRRMFQLSEAETAARESLDLAQQLDALHPRTASALHTLGPIKYDQGDGLTAENLFQQAVEFRQLSFPENHIEILESRIWHRAILTLQDRFREAESSLLDSFKILRG